MKKLLQVATRRLYFEQGTKLFEPNEGTQAGIPCGIWVLRVEKGPRPENVSEESIYRCKIHPSWKLPRSEEAPPPGMREIYLRAEIILPK